MVTLTGLFRDLTEFSGNKGVYNMFFHCLARTIMP